MCVLQSQGMPPALSVQGWPTQSVELGRSLLGIMQCLTCELPKTSTIDAAKQEGELQQSFGVEGAGRRVSPCQRSDIHRPLLRSAQHLIDQAGARNQNISDLAVQPVCKPGQGLEADGAVGFCALKLANALRGHRCAFAQSERAHPHRQAQSFHPSRARRFDSTEAPSRMQLPVYLGQAMDVQVSVHSKAYVMVLRQLIGFLFGELQQPPCFLFSKRWSFSIIS